MEDYIYIIIGVIWLAATVYKATKKKKENAAPQKPATAPTGEKTGVSATRSLLEQLLEGQQPMVPEPEVVELEPEVVELEPEYDEPMLVEVEERKRKNAPQSGYIGYGYKSLESVSGEGVSSLGRITFTDIMKEHETKAGKPVKIDLRKAIIYSAILERPYH
ncbi:MAG: hypothetical protein DRJ15_00040 [Bacteroidetes bacterium]|nr:MAG: hypothetical protein DRJ15_00040 [Bacteroidota bacterium]